MSDKQKVYVAAVGMITPVGANSEMTLTSVKANINKYEESALCNKAYLPMKIASIPDSALPKIDIPNDSPISKQTRYRRMLKLATTAMTEAMREYAINTPVPLYLAGPENLNNHIAPIDISFINLLAKSTKANINLALSKIICTGRSGAISAIEQAFHYLEQNNQHFILVGGVDTYLDLDLLGYLDKDDRISSINNMDGFVPGEGAGFLLLASEHGLSLLNTKPKGILSLPGLSNEIGHRYSIEPYKGEGLAQAISIALKNYNGPAIKTIFSSLNGEHYGVKEYGVAMLRNQPHLDEDTNLTHPIDCFGDSGASLAPILIGLACLGMNKGYYPGPSLVYCSSDNEERGACCIENTA